MELDDSVPESHLALASAIFFGQWNWARAEQEVSRAIELNPGFADTYYFRSKMLIALNRHEQPSKPLRSILNWIHSPAPTPWPVPTLIRDNTMRL